MNAAEDHRNYYNAMVNGHTRTCLKIEEKYGLDGYPPEFVTTVLCARIEAELQERERIITLLTLIGFQGVREAITPKSTRPNEKS